MRIPNPPIDPAGIARCVGEGYWVETTSNDAREQRVREAPDKLAIVDGRVLLGYGEYYRRAERLTRELRDLIDGDRYHFSYCVRTLRGKTPSLRPQAAYVATLGAGRTAAQGGRYGEN